MIEGVIFDMDGLMFDTEGLHMELWENELSQQGFAYTSQIGKSIRGRSRADIHRILEEMLGPGFDFMAALQNIRANAQKRLETDGVAVKPGLYPLLDWLEERGIPMAVATSNNRPSVEANCRAAGVWDRFATVICGEQVRHSKPDPEIFQLAAQALHVQPAHCLVLEDSFNGVRAGAAGGFVTVMVPDLDEPTPEIDALYTRKAESLTEVLDLLRTGNL